MVNSVFEGIRVAGICGAVSNEWLPLEAFVDNGVEPDVIAKFIKQTGVKGRYDAGIKQTASDFCYAAAKQIIEIKKINKSEIGVLVLVTQTADYRSPASACVLHGRLGLDESCLAFDVNLGCSGFTSGMNIISSLLQASDKRYALLLCGDTAVKELDYRVITRVSNSAKMLFGDAGSATLLEKCESDYKLFMRERTDGKRFRAIIDPHTGFRNPFSEVDQVKGGGRMDGVEVFNFSTSSAPELIKETMMLAETTPDDYECLVLHQSNLKIINRIGKLTGFSDKKVLKSLDVFGNTSSASIPLSLVHEYGAVDEKRMIRLMMCGYGIGLSWSTVDCYINTSDILPLIHTDEYFEDGYYDEN